MPRVDDTSEDGGEDKEKLEGLYLQFTHRHETKESPRSRLLRLRQTITNAVKVAGMDTPSGPETHQASNSDTAEARKSTLYCGSYGQMMAALSAGGLTSASCPGKGLQGATRLGALFVAHRLSGGRIEMRKLTLWG